MDWLTKRLVGYRGTTKKVLAPDGLRSTLTFIPEVEGASELWLSCDPDGKAATFGFALSAIVEEERSSFGSTEGYLQRLGSYLRSVSEGSLVSYRLVGNKVRTVTVLQMQQEVMEITSLESLGTQRPVLVRYPPWTRREL